ncbi:MAG: DNA polymerase III subunit beta [Parcubacteria group bacterium]|nr:DNA polymerase III subunit beta [Parcubacteria group bacterium]
MKFISLVENFRQALVISERAIGKSPNLPILGHFLIESEKGKVQISATNLEIAVTTSFSGKIESEGKITVPARTLLNFLSQIGDEKIEVSSRERNLAIASPHHKATFQGLAAEEFPIIPSVDQEESLSIPSRVLKSALSQVIPSASTSDIRPELSSVLLEYSPGENLKLVSTDSARLAEKTLSPNHFQSKRKTKISLLIPLRTAQEVAKISQEKNDEVAIFADASQIEFRWEDTRLVSRILEGEFPDYSSVIPREFVVEGTLPRKKLTEAIRVTGVFSSKLNDVKIIADPEAKTFSFQARDLSLGENEAKVEALEMKGEPLEISFNWRYVLDGLEAMEEENAVLRLGNVASPSMVKSEKDESFIYIVMPIKA